MTRPPDLTSAAGALWLSVMQRYGHRCGCRGQCGKAHRDYGGRCGRRHVDRGTDAQQLLAVPIDAAVSPADAPATPPMLLMARCPACDIGARARAARALGKPVPTDGLFDPAPADTGPPVPSARAVIRIADALNAAHQAGIEFVLGPNRYLHWDADHDRYVATAPATGGRGPTWSGGHAVVLEIADGMVHAHCQCSGPIGSLPLSELPAALGPPWREHLTQT